VSARLKGRFSVGRVVAALALVVALVAISVPAIGKTSNGSATADKDASASATGKRGPRGKRGKTGKTGPAGPAGARGLQGPAGPPGPKGATGATGQQGIQGVPGTPGAKGDQGDPGEPGDPWSVGGTLPAGATETGAWAGGPLASAGQTAQFVPISFPIPLASSVSEHVVPAGGPAPEGCTGGTVSDPTADPGHLCIYVGVITDPAAGVGGVLQPDGNAGVGKSGAVLIFGTETTAQGAAGWGSFAVTAPTS
jgi:Collagen triple helix repeat (20 copies)